MGYRDSDGGSKVSPPVNAYGYTLALNPNEVVQSITLPGNASGQVLAITLSNYTAALPEAAAIATQPKSLTATNGSPATFVVAATGSAPLQYQWQMNSNNLTDGGNISAPRRHC